MSTITVPEELAGHVPTVLRIAAMVETSREAAAVTHLDRSAYGQLCQFMVDFFEPSMQVTVAGLGTSATRLHELADGVAAVVAASAAANASAASQVGEPAIRLPL
jgi:hypothetical protein